MKIFITSATGFVGTQVTDLLLARGHTVLGLARSDENAAILEAKNVTVIRGSLYDLDIIKDAARQADGVIHTAFIHDFSSLGTYVKSVQVDAAVIAAIGDALENTNKNFIVTSAAVGGTATKTTPQIEEEWPVKIPRTANEVLATTLRNRGVNTSVIRLPPVVHGQNDLGFVYMLASIALKNGYVFYVDDGLNHWTSTHKLDVARVYVLAVEHAAPLPFYHPIAEGKIPFIQIAEKISGLVGGLPLKSVTLEEAKGFGFLGLAVGGEGNTSSQITREHLNWEPEQITLFEDIDAGNYDIDLVAAKAAIAAASHSK